MLLEQRALAFHLKTLSESKEEAGGTERVRGGGGGKKQTDQLVAGQKESGKFVGESEKSYMAKKEVGKVYRGTPQSKNKVWKTAK